MTKTYIYARVSTTQQSLDSQKKSCWEYCEEELGLELDDIEIIHDKSTGTDTNREGYQQLMELAKQGKVERVVVKEVSRIARNMSDLNRSISRLCDDYNVAVHIIESGLVINEDEVDDNKLIDDRMVMQILGIAAEIEAKLNKQRARAGLAAAEAAGKWKGRPPFGFDVENGYLTPNQNYEKAIAIIGRIEDDESVRSTARHADVSRSTVRNVVDRKELYFDTYETDYEINGERVEEIESVEE